MKVSIFSDPVFQRFVVDRPVATMAQMIARRILDKDLVDQVFRDNAALQYEQELLFSSLAKLMMNVTLGKYESVNAGYKVMASEMGVSVTAVYNKLQRIESQTSRALVRHAYQYAVEVQREIGGVQRNLLPGYAMRILDGNHLAGTEHRIKETRTLKAAPLPGKSLVVFDPRYNCVRDFIPIEDGHAQELSELDSVLETLEANELWIADRNFCTLKYMYSIENAGSCFIVRHHKKLHGIVSGPLKRIGKSDTGEVFENKLILPTFAGQTITVRRIVCKLFKPTQSGETEVILLTNLPASEADGVRISELYCDRWRVEVVFNHLTMNLNCEVNTLCYPPAALFCFAMSLVAYNSFSILKAVVAHVHGQDESKMLSHYYLADEVARSTDGLLVAIQEESWSQINSMPLKSFVSQLLKATEHIDMKRYRKAVRRPKNPPPKRKGDCRTTHVSTKRLIENRQ
jgi:IS4 transposase